MISCRWPWTCSEVVRTLRTPFASTLPFTALLPVGFSPLLRWMIQSPTNSLSSLHKPCLFFWRPGLSFPAAKISTLQVTLALLWEWWRLLTRPWWPYATCVLWFLGWSLHLPKFAWVWRLSQSKQQTERAFVWSWMWTHRQLKGLVTNWLQVNLRVWLIWAAFRCFWSS